MMKISWLFCLLLWISAFAVGLIQSNPSLTCSGVVCKNGTCVSHGGRCDHIGDCADYSDEVDCDYLGKSKCIGDDVFRCNDGHCIMITHVCDRHDDCDGGEDEENCPGLNSNLGQECAEGLIPCHGECENPCDSFCTIDSAECENKCEPDEMHCLTNGKPICITRDWVCDGEPDCDDNSDEANCGAKKGECHDLQYKCNDGSCIVKDFKCDDVHDCPNGEDEEDCEHLETYRLPECGKDQYTCYFSILKSNYCIPLHQVCNGFKDCYFGEDENYCDDNFCHNGFICHSGDMCIKNEERCDGKLDCWDGSDEASSECQLPSPPSTSPKCKDTEFQCSNGTCLPSHMHCDGKMDCADQSDEDCPLSCESLGCEHCRLEQHGPVCYCPRGYILDNKNQDIAICLDENECEKWNGGCSHYCNNTVGSFVCYCAGGYTQSRPTRPGSCVQKSSVDKVQDTVVVVSTVHGIHGISQERENLLLPWSRPIYMLDIDYRRKELFFISDIDHQRKDILFVSEDSVNTQEKCLHKISFPSMFGQERSHDKAELKQILVGNIQGLAVDWITGHLFFSMREPLTSRMTSSIGVKPNDEKHSIKTLITANKLFYDVAIDPTRGIMVWIQQNSHSNYGIVKSWMNGQNIESVTSQPRRPVGLTLDPVVGRLYWMVGQAIHAHDLEGGLSYIFTDKVSSFKHFHILEGRAWLSSTNEHGYIADVFASRNEQFLEPVPAILNMNHPGPLRVGYADGRSQPMNASILESCKVMCDESAICLFTPGGAKCVCSDGLRKEDNKCVVPATTTLANNAETRPPLVTITEKTTVKSSEKIPITSAKSTISMTSGKQATLIPTQKTSQKNPQVTRPSTTVPTQMKSSSVPPVSCKLFPCQNGGSCIMVSVDRKTSNPSKNVPMCLCTSGYDGDLCQVKISTFTSKQPASQQTTQGPTVSPTQQTAKPDKPLGLWWAGFVVIGCLLVVMLVACAICYARYKRSHGSLYLSSIKYLHKKRNSSSTDKQSDKSELIPEISFGNPNFQEAIDEQAEQDKDWWRRMLHRSRLTTGQPRHEILREDPESREDYTADTLERILEGDWEGEEDEGDLSRLTTTHTPPGCPGLSKPFF